MLRVAVYYATVVSIAWSAGLTALAAAGNTWVLDRVAGSLFVGEAMPLLVRVVYAAFTVLMLGVVWLTWRYYSNTASSRQRRLGRLIMLMFGLSAALNAISPSPTERYNAIAAAVILIGVGILKRRPTSSYVDLRTRR